MAAPLTQLTSTKVPFGWSQAAQSAFLRLKRLFSSAPVLCHPDPAIQFVVEVDASNSGVGAVLSQHLALDNKLHPCSFFSRRLSSAETNYDVGNRELLAVVLALQEWRHWLEGAAHPFFVWTDHLNLAYIQTALRLNSRQARWALFLGRFRFTLTYRPGSKNGKANALSPVPPPGDAVGGGKYSLSRLCHRGSPMGDRAGGAGRPARTTYPRGLPSGLDVCSPGRPQGRSPVGARVQGCLPSGVSPLSFSSDSGFGGPQWLPTPRVSWPPVPSVPAAIRHTVLRLVF